MNENNNFDSNGEDISGMMHLTCRRMNDLSDMATSHMHACNIESSKFEVFGRKRTIILVFEKIFI